MTTAGSPAKTDGGTFSTAVLDKAACRDLLARSNWQGALRLAIHGGLIAIFGALILAKVPLWQALLLPQGILVIFLFAPLHECIHRTAFRHKWCNDAVAALCGWLLLLPPVWFRHFHLNHHRFTNNPSRDPELAVPKPDSRTAYLAHLTGLAVWATQIQVLLGNTHGRASDTFIPKKARNRVAMEARWFLALYVIAFAAAGEGLLWIWVVPALIGQPFLRAFLLAEHFGCPQVADMMANSRTTFTVAPVRFITWNMCYHAEHHALPVVPFHRLPAFHDHTQPYLKQTADGYLSLHRQVWDDLN
jgi:fatty acid desaturase